MFLGYGAASLTHRASERSVPSRLDGRARQIGRHSRVVEGDPVVGRPEAPSLRTVAVGQDVPDVDAALVEVAVECEPAALLRQMSQDLGGSRVRHAFHADQRGGAFPQAVGRCRHNRRVLADPDHGAARFERQRLGEATLT